MKKLLFVLLLCFVCISVYAIDVVRLVSFDIVDDSGKPTGKAYLSYEEDKSGTYETKKEHGTVKWNVRIYPEKGEFYFILKENGKDKDVSTSSSGRSADIGCVYTITFTSVKKDDSKSIYGGLKISQSTFQTNEILCYTDSDLTTVFEDKEFLAGNTTLDVSIKSNYGSYSLGRLNLDGIEELLFDKTLYLEAIKLMEEGRYSDALDVFDEYRNTNLESYTHYNALIKETECSQKAGRYAVGGIGPAGGYIFYDCDADNDTGNADDLISSVCGWKYLEAAPEDLSSGYQFGDFIEIGTSSAIGKGKTNTVAIINKLGAGLYAAKACWDYECNGYDDWFLPSKDELNLLYHNLKNKGVGNFGEYFYWSSSESFESLYAWVQYFNDGSQYAKTCGFRGPSGNYNYVRPIRAFL